MFQESLSKDNLIEKLEDYKAKVCPLKIGYLKINTHQGWAKIVCGHARRIYPDELELFYICLKIGNQHQQQ